MNRTPTATSPDPWARRDGEPMRWYARFERFRLAGPTRSLLGVYKREKARKGLMAVPAAWTDAAAKWSWRERAEAWDATVLERDAKAHAEWRRKARNRRLRLLDGLGFKLRKAVKLATLEGLPIHTLAGAIKQAMDAERAEFGDLEQDEAPREQINELVITVVDASGKAVNYDGKSPSDGEDRSP